jgi:sugar phosphate isomerase/epimerase
MKKSARLSLSVHSNEELFVRAAKTGVKFIELVSFPPLEGRVGLLAKALKSAGLKAATFHAPTGPVYDVGNLDPRGREKALGLHMEQLQFCKSLGIGCYVIHPGFENYLNQNGGRWDDEKKIIVYRKDEEAMAKLWKVNSRSIGRLGAYAESLGVKIALETGPTNLITVPETLAIVRNARRGNVGVCLDTGHVNIGGMVKPQDAIEEVGKRLWALHLNDNNADGDFHMNLGKGNIDWAAVVHALDAMSYQGTFNMEFGGDWTSEEAWKGARESASFLKGILD